MLLKYTNKQLSWTRLMYIHVSHIFAVSKIRWKALWGMEILIRLQMLLMEKTHYHFTSVAPNDDGAIWWSWSNYFCWTSQAILKIKTPYVNSSNSKACTYIVHLYVWVDAKKIPFKVWISNNDHMHMWTVYVMN